MLQFYTFMSAVFGAGIAWGIYRFEKRRGIEVVTVWEIPFLLLFSFAMGMLWPWVVAGTVAEFIEKEGGV